MLLADIDYIGLAKAYFLEYETKRFIEQTVTLPLGRGCVLPDTVNRDVVFENKAMSLSFLDQQGDTRVLVQSPAFGGTTLSAELLVQRPRGHETVNVVIPWSAHQFNFNSKQFCLPAGGAVSLGAQTFSFEPGRAFGCLDFSRGIWPYRTFWNWACFSGTQNGRTIGINLGGSWTDGTGMTENGICVDGRVSKIGEDLVFSDHPSDQMKPWAITAPVSGRIDLRLIPFFERVAKTNRLIIRSEFRQVFGRFSGIIVTDNGEAIQVEDIDRLGGAAPSAVVITPSSPHASASRRPIACAPPRPAAVSAAATVAALSSLKPLAMSRPPGFRAAAIAPARSTMTEALMLATTTSKAPTASSTLPSSTRTTAPRPFRRTFSRAACAACGSLSSARTLAAPRRAAARARMPEPVPRSSTSAPGCTVSSRARRHISVVGCWPVPKAIPGSRRMTASPVRARWSARRGR